MKANNWIKRGLIGAGLVLFGFNGCDCEHGSFWFGGLIVNELRYVRGETSDDQNCGAFIELKGYPGYDIGGLTVNIFEGGTPYHSFTLPAGEAIGADGYYLISNTSTVSGNDPTVAVTVDYVDASFSSADGWDWLPAATDSGVTIVHTLPIASAVPEVVDSVRYNPSGTLLEADDSEGAYDGLCSWWETGDPTAEGVGELQPAPGLPYYSQYDAVWGISRVGEHDTGCNSDDFLVASVTPGAENEKLYLDDATEIDAYWKPVISEVMPNTNGASDEGSFIEIYGAAGLDWDAGPGYYEIYALYDGSGHGDRSHYILLEGAIPSDSYFVLADAETLSEIYGGEAPDQEIECADLSTTTWDCSGSDEYTWNWMDNDDDFGVRLEYWISSDRRIIVDSLRWGPSDEGETENVYRQGEGLAPLGDTSPAVSLTRLGSDTHFNRNDFVFSDPSPGAENIEPASEGALSSIYPESFTELGVAPSSYDYTYPELNKTVLFDQTKKQKWGSTGHWVIDDNGDYSDWAWQLFELGYTVDAVGDGQTASTLTAGDLSGVDVLVMGEPQTDYSASEKTTIETFLEDGGSLFFLANHLGSDRDHDGTDSWNVWNDSLELDDFTGVSLAEATTTGENLLLSVCAGAVGHDIVTDLETAACDPASDPSCTFYDTLLYREPGVSLYSGAFVEIDAVLPSGVAAVTELLEGERPYISRDPHRLDSYGGSAPIEAFAVAIELAGGGKIVLLGDSAVLNDGGSSDYATYAAMMAYCAYGTDHRNSLFGINAVNWLAGEVPNSADEIPPAMAAAP
ncbi:MAG TPA: hypothetical protein PLI51_07185 [bacterium]|nr:hypothetical protein [bacterium]HPQ66488.1 hypothetical protein [bacterium]